MDYCPIPRIFFIKGYKIISSLPLGRCGVCFLKEINVLCGIHKVESGQHLDFTVKLLKKKKKEKKLSVL